MEDAHTPASYGIAVVAVLGGAFLMPPFPLFFLIVGPLCLLGIIAVLSIRSKHSLQKEHQARGLSHGMPVTPMQMSLAHAILGWLQKEPMSGYDLKKQFDQGAGYLWPVDQMQIYRTLDRLVEQGYVSVHEEIQHRRPNRKVYTLTETGREELRQWLTSPQSLPALRDPLLIQIFFAASLSNAEILEQLAHQHAEHSKLLSYYQQKILVPLDAPVGTRGEVSREQMLRRQVLEYSLRREQTYLEWLEQAMEAVRQLSG